jgi:DNA-damage-inducible protein J
VKQAWKCINRQAHIEKSIDKAHNKHIQYSHIVRKKVLTMTNITIRIDETVKKEAESLFDNLGMTISGAINIFFRQAIREQAIPFQIRARTTEEKYEEYFNPYNMKILKESIAQAERGETITFTVAEFEAMAESEELPKKAVDFLESHKKVGSGND